MRHPSRWWIYLTFRQTKIVDSGVTLKVHLSWLEELSGL